MRRSILVAAFASFALVSGPPVRAASPPQPPAQPPLPPGMAEYILVLWPAGSPIADGVPGTINEKPPDVSNFGGTTVATSGNQQVIFLPPAAATQLRAHKAVAYLQRVWRGEPVAGWNESYPATATSNSKLKATPDSDVSLQWGPKDYTYDGSGNIKQIGTDGYVYDTAGRLIQSAVDTKVETYQYDAFGNLTQKAVAGGNAVVIPVDAQSNRISGVTYDAAGNATTAEDGRRTYEYDSAGSLTRVKQSFYDRRMIYDAEDERIGMIVMNGPTEDSLSRWMIRDFDGRILREYKGNNLTVWTWEQDYFYAENALVGGENITWGFACGTPGGYCWGGRRHYHLDHLGSVRMVTNDVTLPAHAQAVSEHEYYPFGTTITKTYQEQLNWADPHIDSMRFAGQWRDFLGILNVDNTEYVDYMHARYYDPNLGRFLSVDPIRGNADRPQSWNRFVYVHNTPITESDPTGRCGEAPEYIGPPKRCPQDVAKDFSVFGFASATSTLDMPIRPAGEAVGLAGVSSNTGRFLGTILAVGAEVGSEENYVGWFHGSEKTTGNGKAEAIDLKEVGLGAEVPFMAGAGVGFGKYTTKSDSGFFAFVAGGALGDHLAIGGGFSNPIDAAQTLLNGGIKKVQDLLVGKPRIQVCPLCQ